MNLLRVAIAAMVIVATACGTTSNAGESAEPPPPATVAFSLKTTPFVIEPGTEIFKCYYTTLPNDAEAAVARFESTMSKGSHHMILFALEAPGAPDGTLGDCNLRPKRGAIPFPLYLSQETHQEAAFPTGVAMPLKAKQAVAVQMHYLNAGQTPLTAQVEIAFHALTAGATFARAGIFASFHDDIAVPPHGTQTVSGRCQVPSDVKFLSLTTHSHWHTTRAIVGRVEPGDSSVPKILVETSDYERPTLTRYQSPFLDLEGDKIFYSCEYRNETDDVVRVGDSAVNEEMCMAVGYYFPANGLTVCLGSISLQL